MTSSIPSLALLVPLFTGILALTLLILGLRGRRLGTHPHCAHCGFDLFGLATDAPTCPECGRNIRARGATAIGKHTRSKGLITAGAILLFLLLGGTTLTLFSRFTNTNWNPYKPLWMLRREAFHADVSTRLPALAELAGRMADRRWQGDSLHDFLNDILLRQNDATQTWLPELGDFFEAAYPLKHITDPLWTQYLRQGIAPGLVVVRRQVRSGDPIPYHVSSARARFGALSTTQRTLRFKEIEFLSDSTSWHRSTETLSFNIDPRAVVTLFASIPPAAYATRITPGSHTCQVRLKYTLQLASAGTNVGPLLEDISQETVTLTLLPADQPSARLVADETLRPRITAAITPELRRIATDGALHGQITVHDLPTHVAFDIIGLTDQGEVKFGAMVGRTGRNSVSSIFTYDGPVPNDHLDLLLRPNLNAATMTVDISEAWDGEIKFPAVPIKKP